LPYIRTKNSESINLNPLPFNIAADCFIFVIPLGEGSKQSQENLRKIFTLSKQQRKQFDTLCMKGCP